MKKRYHLIGLVALFSCFTACNKDDDPAPSVDNLSGYWELEEIFEDGDEADWDDYYGGLNSLFVYLGEDDFVTVILNMVVRDGEWDLDESELAVDLEYSDDFDFEVASISGQELRVTDGDFTLVFKRIEVEEFPDRRCTATVNNVSFKAEEVIGEWDGGVLLVGGFEDYEELEGIIIGFEFDPDDLDEGETYDLTDNDVIAYFYNDLELAEITDGEITFEILTDDQVVATFEFEGELPGGQDVNVKNGVIKTPINN